MGKKFRMLHADLYGDKPPKTVLPSNYLKTMSEKKALAKKVEKYAKMSKKTSLKKKTIKAKKSNIAIGGLSDMTFGKEEVTERRRRLVF